MADQVNAEERASGVIYAEAPLQEIERYIRKVHGRRRNLRPSEIDVLRQEVNAQMRVIRQNWPVETGTSRLAWYFTINPSAGQVAVIFHNPMFYAGFITRKGETPVRDGGSPWFTRLLPAVWKANRARLERRLKDAIDKTERQEQTQAAPFSATKAQDATNLLANLIRGLRL